MGWPASFGVGVITAIVACLLAGWVANLCVDWYNMSSFEGASGYFVIAMALLALLGGLLLGLLLSRLVGGEGGGFLKALGLSQVIVIGLFLVIGVTARLLADIPPKLDGETMLLAVEIRWPLGKSPADAEASGEWSLRLGSLANHTMRASRTGPLWREDARLEEGRWVMPGAVNLFTSRGNRMLDVLPEGIVDTGWIMRLPGHPGREFLQWSEWYPHARQGEPLLSDGFRYRFRVVPVNQPIRTKAVGPFEVDTIARGFSEVISGGRPMAWNAWAQFQVRYLGQTVAIETAGDSADTTRYELMDAVAVLAGPVPALMVQVGAPQGEGLCYLIWAEADEIRTLRVGMSGDGVRASPLTNDMAQFQRPQKARVPNGRLDLATFDQPGQYLFRDVVVNTRNRTVRSVATDDHGRMIGRIPPLAVSPDGDSFVRIEWGEDSYEDYQLAVIRLDTGTIYRVPVDRLQTRLAEIDQLDPAWVANYYEWQPGPDGADLLAPRSDAVPLPRRGHLSQEGSYREYRVFGASPELRPAVIGFLESRFDAEALPHSETDYAWTVRIGEATVSVGYDSNGSHVGIWMSPGQDTTLVATIAGQFDAALQEGQFEAYFLH